MTSAAGDGGKAGPAYQRSAEVYDARRPAGASSGFPLMKAQYGSRSMPETGENVAEEFHVSRADQDAFALRSQTRAKAAQVGGALAARMVAIEVSGGKAGPITVTQDEHPRHDTTAEGLAKLKPIVRPGGTVTAGNASGVNDGAQALIVASAGAAKNVDQRRSRASPGWRAPGSLPASWGSGRCRRRGSYSSGSA